MRNQPAYAQAYGAAVLAAGLFSFFSHASLTRLGEWFDLMGVYAIAGFLLAYNLVRLAGLAGRGFAGLYAALLGALGVQMALAPQLQQIAVGLLIGAAVVLEAGVRLRRKPQAQDRWLAAAAACFILGGAFWLLNGRAPDCNPASGLPWHTGWHLLSAAAAGLLFRYYISEDLG
ncbi:MAG TPA: hypothetical protein VF498_17120 [Anaerolineales bacterium]